MRVEPSSPAKSPPAAVAGVAQRLSVEVEKIVEVFREILNRAVAEVEKTMEVEKIVEVVHVEKIVYVERAAPAAPTAPPAAVDHHMAGTRQELKDAMVEQQAEEQEAVRQKAATAAEVVPAAPPAAPADVTEDSQCVETQYDDESEYQYE